MNAPEINDSERKQPLLSICILTYNRGAQVDALLSYLLASILPKAGDLVDLLVVNNCSTDNTESLLTKHERAGVRVIRRSNFLPTAEENMMRSVEYCRGKYLWFLGDDDYPITDSVFDLINRLKDGSVDFLVANSINVMEGRVLSDNFINMNSSYLTLPIHKFIAGTGLLALIAGMSRLVFRKDMVDVEEGLNILSIQSIYSHVFWLLICFRGKEVSVFKNPLVRYTTLTVQNDKNRFKKHQVLMDHGSYYYWGFGLSLLLEYSIRKNALTTDILSRTFDTKNDGSSARLLDFVLHSAFRQVLAYVKYGKGREEVSMEEFLRFSDLIVSCDPEYFPLLKLLERLMGIARSNSSRFIRTYRAKGIVKEFLVLFSTHTDVADRLHRLLYRGELFGYRIYHGPTKWVAINSRMPADHIVLCLDPHEVYPEIFSADNREELEKRILSQVFEHKKLSETNSSQKKMNTNQDKAISLNRIATQTEIFIEIIRQSTWLSRWSYKLIGIPLRILCDKVRRFVGQIKRFLQI